MIWERQNMSWNHETLTASKSSDDGVGEQPMLVGFFFLADFFDVVGIIVIK